MQEMRAAQIEFHSVNHNWTQNIYAEVATKVVFALETIHS